MKIIISETCRHKRKWAECKECKKARIAPEVTIKIPIEDLDPEFVKELLDDLKNLL